MVEDYGYTGLSLRHHSVSFLRPDLAKRRIITCAEAMASRDGRWLEVAGIVLVRQRPGSAKGVPNALPQFVRTSAKSHLHDIRQAETCAECAFGFFVETCGAKWDKAVEKLVKGREVLLIFYDFPGEHWKHIRMSNPIESTFPFEILRQNRYLQEILFCFSVGREKTYRPAQL